MKVWDEVSEFTPEMWDKLQSYAKAQKYKTLFGYPKTVEDDELIYNWIDKWQQIKKENMTKRERFLKAGGLFEKKNDKIAINTIGKIIRITDRAGMTDTYNGNTFNITLESEQKFQDKDYPNQKAHFENILSNTKSDTWIASRDREIKITDLADKQLVNIMRYLVAHWMEIKECALRNYNETYTEHSHCDLGVLEGKLTNWYLIVKDISGPQEMNQLITPFTQIVNEFCTRFGYDSLNSIYDGN